MAKAFNLLFYSIKIGYPCKADVSLNCGLFHSIFIPCIKRMSRNGLTEMIYHGIMILR